MSGVGSGTGMTGLPPLIEAMAAADFYPHHPAQVELRQTHISYLFLAGDEVYKVKKPVRFSFLDYSTLDRRHHFCSEEIRLNRRLAPDIYLGVVQISQRAGHFSMQAEGELPPGWTVAEYAVKMRRLPDEWMLDSLVREGRISHREIEAVADKLVQFHREAAVVHAPTYGSPESVWRRLSDNFKETERFVGETISERDYRTLEQYSRRSLDAHLDLLRARVREMKVREGHGDLRAEHISLARGISIFDCIEFDERLRYSDVASEVGFLAMDLDFLGASDLSSELLTAYAEKTGDEAFWTLLPFYQCYRAYVRGKVESLKSRESEVPKAERDKARLQARRYFHLAYRYAKGAPPPAVVIVCGLVGTGKSTLARILSDRTGYQLFHSDVVRKSLAGTQPSTRTAGEYKKGLYSDTSTRLTYRTLLARAERPLKSKKGVIIDATFKKAEHRQWFLKLAADFGVPVLFVECRSQDREVYRRLKKREQKPEEVSDATWEVYLRQRDEFVPFSDIPDRSHLVVKTDTELTGALARVEEFLYDRPAR